MIFSSLTFFFFFLFYLVFHFFTPILGRNYLIIIGSTIFYSWWLPSNTWVPFFLILIAFIGYKILFLVEQKRKYLVLISTLLIIYLPLIFFKYLGFIYSDILTPVFGLEPRDISFQIPLGISFITFTLTSFLIDVYKQKYKNKVNLVTFSAYILYFPQLIAGPILRPNELIPQLQNPPKKFEVFKNISFPILIFTIGCLKKFLFADYISSFVENVFDTSSFNTTLETILAIYSFSVQIYCDFSGYTDMAIGVSLLLGINLPFNFLSPYQSVSIVDFWRRWHITLSDFLRDYIYIPLGGNRKGLKRQNINLFLTMLLGGLWHGANWTFLIWGGMHGIGLTLIRLKEKFLGNSFRLPRPLSIFITFNFVAFTWIFFRSETFADSINIFQQVFSFNFSDASYFFSDNLFPIFLILIFFTTHKWDKWESLKKISISLPKAVFIPLIFVMWLIIISFASSSSGAFIYFDF